jgi:uncharacterized protein (TIGR03663 family)
MNRAATLGLLLALAAALLLRCCQPDARPMHNDEGVNALKFKALWERGVYRYDPDEYHGPALPYFTLAWMKVTRAPEIAQQTEGRLRFVTVLFGVGLILLLPLMADGLGRRACICAAVFTAISPAMVFYSRYYIHEMLLVFFTFLAFAAAWRYRRKGKIKWALLAGAAVGLMQATKETFVLTLGAAAIAWVANEFWDRRIAAAGISSTSPPPLWFGWRSRWCFSRHSSRTGTASPTRCALICPGCIARKVSRRTFIRGTFIWNASHGLAAPKARTGVRCSFWCSRVRASWVSSKAKSTSMPVSTCWASSLSNQLR